MIKEQLVLVTGGAGFIGSVLVGELIKKGYKVRVFDKLYFGADSLDHLKKDIEIIQGDVRDIPPHVMEGVSAVMHLGSLSNDPTADFDPKANHAINFEGTMRVAEAAKKAGIGRFTFASSCAVIGFHIEDIADENYKPNPQSEYAQSKLDAENGLLSLISSDFSPIIFRQATVFGFSRRMRYDLVVNTMVKDAFLKGRIFVYHAGEMWRPLIDVKDVALAHINAIEMPEDKVKGQIFNLVHENFKIDNLAYHLQEVLGPRKKVEVEVQIGDKESRSYRVTGEKYFRIFGKTPVITVKESALKIFDTVSQGRFSDFDNPLYYNIDWMKKLIARTGGF